MKPLTDTQLVAAKMEELANEIYSLVKYMRTVDQDTEHSRRIIPFAFPPQRKTNRNI